MPNEAVAPKARRPALPSLTGVRFAAAFYVVLSHTRVWLERHTSIPRPIDNLLSNGSLAVCFFFVLSGFILAYTYQAPFRQRSEFVKFWEARFARIYPVYFLSLLLLVPFQLHHLDRKMVFAVLLMVQAWNPWHAELTGAWNYPAWSLSVEAFFYLCFPFLQNRFALASRKTLYVAGGIFLLLAILGHTPYESLGTWDPNAYSGFRIPLPVVRLPEFVLGMIAGNFFVRFGTSRRRSILSLIAVIASLVLLAATAGPWISLIVIPFSLLIYCLASSDDFVVKFFGTPLMVLLGGASYAVYLLQLPVREWVRVTLGPVLAAVHIPDAPLTPVLLVLFSILVFRYWEEPLRRIIRRSLATLR